MLKQYLIPRTWRLTKAIQQMRGDGGVKSDDSDILMWKVTEEKVQKYHE